ncbi:MAG: FKBP-type peptidyl-prolyl cis-trans isomerase [Planctomycetota bacterium]|jgi:peptidylprolyl isomerase
MANAKQGDKVKVHYTGKLDDGNIFDTSKDRESIEFTLGEGKIIPGFEKAVEGMAPGDTKTEKIPADNAYGQRKDELVFQVQRTEIPQNVDIKPGMVLEMKRQDGMTLPVTVKRVTEADVTLDANHPLAGQDLTFEIELVEFVETA